MKQMADREELMREDFFESHSTFAGNLDIPLGSGEHIGCGGMGCCIRRVVNGSVKLGLDTRVV